MKVLNEFKDKLKTIYDEIRGPDCKLCDIESRQNNTERLAEMINRQNLIIDSLINNKYTSDSISVVIIKPYRGRPYIVKDGKRLDTNTMTGFDVDWDRGRDIEIKIRNE